MKTVDFFETKLREDLNDLADPSKYTKREATIILNRIEGYKICKVYLQTNPSEDFIKSEISRLEAYVNEKLLDFDSKHDKSKIPQKLYTTLRNSYEKKWDIKHKQNQLHWLRLLLD
jgi:hypothetical protein